MLSFVKTLAVAGLTLCVGVASAQAQSQGSAQAVAQAGAQTGGAAGTSPYPITNPLVATVVGTPKALQADLSGDVDFSLHTIDPLVTRDTPPTLRYARPMQYVLAAQPNPAPLAFVIAGTGDSALSSKCVLLAKALYEVGYSVACLPSPTSVTFMLGAATYPVPGRMPTDVADLYRLMKAVRDDAQGSAINITGYSLTGWSLGATQAAFIAQLDDREQVFHFKHVLLLNPAVSVWTSVERMDTLLAKNLPDGINGIPAFVAKGLGGLKQVYSSDQTIRFNEDFLYQAYKQGAADQKDIGAIIGLAFRLALANMAFAADVITHSGVIVPKDVTLSPYDSMDTYIQRSFSMSFSSYINELLVPYWNRDGRHVSKSQLIREDDMHSIAGFLASDTQMGVFTNADDPILNADEVGFLRQTFGDRARIQPYGGHMGNLSYRDTIRALQAFFSS